MFTGIIEKIGKILQINITKQGASLCVETEYQDLTVGESICVSGVCLTVSEVDLNGKALFYLSPETLSKSSFSKIKAGDSVNLERALEPSSRMGGHFVQGHVDGLAYCIKINSNSDGYELFFQSPNELAKYCVKKGSIALNGVSLTLNQVDDTGICSVFLIPFTWKNTNLSLLKTTDPIHVEVDVIAKYVEKLCQNYQKPLNA
ncbi:MAG: riboflavin synthase [Deltaproteobacteria bacterium]|nr:riboflavin synthase [Deltaproteobacteria bacterium]